MDTNNKINFPTSFPKQHQSEKPGVEFSMNPRPVYEHEAYKHGNRLEGKVAIITGGDSGIGRAVSIAYAKEGADVAVMYYKEQQDAEETKALVEKQGRKCLLISGDIANEEFCKASVKEVISKFGKINILVNNAGEHYPQSGIENVTKDQLIRTFEVNVFSVFYMTKAVIPHMTEGDSIINTVSITAYAGNEELIDYSSSKGALVTFTRSMALSLATKKIRVNAVAPGSIWTPLIVASFSENKVSTFGSDAAMGRAGQPVELAPSYVFLASNDASYMTGEVLHVNGGKMVTT